MYRKNPEYNSIGQFIHFGSKECIEHNYQPFYTLNGLNLKDEFKRKDLIKEGECCIRCSVCGKEKEYIHHNHKYRKAGILVQNPVQIPLPIDYTLNFDFLNVFNKDKPITTKFKKVEFKGNNTKGFTGKVHSRICGNGCAYREWWDTKAFNNKSKVLQEICPLKRQISIQKS